MLELKYLNSEKTYKVNFKAITQNIIQLMGDFPIQTDGFTLSRIDMEDNWDYTNYTTIYREIDGGVQLSNDGSVYVEPETPDMPTLEPYVPSLEDVKTTKVCEMNRAQQETIQNGVAVTLTDGTTEHFTLTEHDQTSLVALQTQVVAGVDQIPWHTSDTAEHCKYYSNTDMALITSKTLSYVTYHVTYFRDLRIYINSLTTQEEVAEVFYGMIIPIEYQSQPLQDMLASMI